MEEIRCNKVHGARMMDDHKEALPQPRPTIEVIYAGGTISSLATAAGYREGGHEVDLVSKLEEHSPDYQPVFDLGHKEVAYTGLSENMDEAYLEVIDSKVDEAMSRDPQGIFMTHGTDSLEQTARHLRKKFIERLKEKKTRLIITAANDDLEEPNTDAWDNLEFGLESASSDVEPDVYVAFHRRLIPADEVVKLPYISGGESTFVSRSDPIYAEALRQQQERSRNLITQLEQVYGGPHNGDQAISYDVNIIRQNHNELLEYLDAHDDVKAILLTLYHSGTANTEKPDQSVAELVNKLRNEKGIMFFGVTENGEPVDLHSYETSIKLREAGVIPLYDMPKDVALAKLRLLDAQLETSQLIDAMLDSKVGEITESEVIPNDIDRLKQLYSS